MVREAYFVVGLSLATIGDASLGGFLGKNFPSLPGGGLHVLAGSHELAILDLFPLC
jgi:hypothetical protein